MNLAFLGDALDHWKAWKPGGRFWHGVKEEARRVPRNRLNSRMKSWASRRKAFLGHSTTTGPYNPSHKCLESPKPNSDRLAFAVQLPDRSSERSRWRG